jgi:glycosyltransferase involved in cell wall biosynthesis
VVLAYHGNRAHLEAMAGTVTPAIEELGRRRAVRLVCVTNHERYGLPDRGLPDGNLVEVDHVQFEPGAEGAIAPSLAAAIGAADIGLVPNLLPVEQHRRALRLTASDNATLAYEPFDWLVRFKASSNPGRLYPFARLGVPVVADFTPSLAQFVDDGVSGCLAATAEGWFDALDRLAASATLRTSLAQTLRARLDEAVTRQVPDLLAFLSTLPDPEPFVPAGRASAEDDLAALGDFASTARPGLTARIRAKLGG